MPVPKTLGELQYGIAAEGPKASLQLLEGSLLTILSVGYFDGDIGAGAVVQCERGDSKVWFATFSEYVMATLETNRENEPYTATLISHESKGGRTYWTLE